MKVDISRLESKGKEQASKLSEVTKTLEDTLARFGEAVRERREKRESIAENVKKAVEARDETANLLKQIIRKMDISKQRLEANKEELKTIEMEKAVSKGKYKELLSGRVPSQEQEAERLLMADNGYDFERGKELFLKQVESAFDGLAGRINELKDRGGELKGQVDADSRRVVAYQRKTEILRNTLNLYKRELRESDSGLKDAIKEEEMLIQEFMDFTERLHSVASIPGAVSKILNGSAMDEPDE